MPHKKPRLFFKKYTLLDGTEKVLLERVGSGSIIKRFDRTPIPKKKNDVVCPHFLELKWSYGCPFSCSWCYLQGTLRRLQTKTSPVVKDYDTIVRHVNAFFDYDEPEILNAGEISDSLMTEWYPNPFSKLIVPFFDEQDLHKLLFVTKSDYVKNLLELRGRNTIVSFSVNAEKVAKRWERGAPAPYRRIEAAKELVDVGYIVRIRIDPVIPIKGWVLAYRRLIDKLMEVSPERVTIGSLRGLTTTIREARDKSWVRYLSKGEKTNWGKRCRFDLRCRVYEDLINYLFDEYGYKNVALCKETLGIWEKMEEKFGLRYTEIKCNCML